MLHVSVSLCVCVLFLCWCWKRRLDRRPHIVKLSLKKKKKLFPRWWKCGENNKPPALCAMTDVFSWEKPHKHTDYSHSLLLCNNYTCWQDVLLLLIPYKLMDAEIFCSMNNGICWKCPSPEGLATIAAEALARHWRFLLSVFILKTKSSCYAESSDSCVHKPEISICCLMLRVFFLVFFLNS